MSSRPIFGHEHRDFRESFGHFLASEVAPGYPEVDFPALFAAAAEHGFVSMAVPEEHGGAGVEDPLFGAVLVEEAMLAGFPEVGLVFGAHNEACVPALPERFAPALASGELISALALDGAVTATGDDGCVLSGSAELVLGGRVAGVFLIAAVAGDRSRSLYVVPSDAPGLEVSASEDLVGLHSGAFADVRFNDVAAERLDEVAVTDLATAQRLSLAVAGVAGARTALAVTVEYVRDRKAFGVPIASFENTKMALAGVAADVDAVQMLIDACLVERGEGALTPARAAAAKLRATDLYCAAVDAGVQLHGGYGYMTEYAIARAYADARFLRLHGGTSEALKHEIADEISL